MTLMDGEFFRFDNPVPVICQKIQPWKEHSEEDILNSLLGCIHKHWRTYKKNNYTFEQAISDAYLYGIKPAIEIDKRAPSIARSTQTCNCGNKIKMPNIMPGDERANKINNIRVVMKRTFYIKCNKCGSEFTVKRVKSIFSTLVFSYIRAAIQKGVREAYDRESTDALFRPYTASLDANVGDGDSTFMETAPDRSLEYFNDDGELRANKEYINMVKEIINDLTIQQCRVISMRYGIFGRINDIVNKDLECLGCKHKFSILIDFMNGISTVRCPQCGKTIEVDPCICQTDIAKVMGVAKNRVRLILKAVFSKLFDKFENVDYGRIFV